jgi:hypothetical protein
MTALSTHAERIPLIAVALIGGVFAANWWLAAGQRRPSPE